MLPTLKENETHEQFSKRLLKHIEKQNATIEAQVAANVELRNQNQDELKTNPRTEELYYKEAQEMFKVLALGEHFLRNKNPDIAKTILQECIQKLGFNAADMFQDLCIVPGAYDAKK